MNTNNLFTKIEWLKQSEESKVIQLQKPLTADGFVLANLDVSGFYRVNYDEKSWENIAQQLVDNKNVIYFLNTKPQPHPFLKIITFLIEFI